MHFSPSVSENYMRLWEQKGANLLSVVVDHIPPPLAHLGTDFVARLLSFLIQIGDTFQQPFVSGLKRERNVFEKFRNFEQKLNSEISENLKVCDNLNYPMVEGPFFCLQKCVEKPTFYEKYDDWNWNIKFSIKIYGWNFKFFSKKSHFLVQPCPEPVTAMW